MPGIVKILAAKDIPGEPVWFNDQDQPVFCDRWSLRGRHLSPGDWRGRVKSTALEAIKVDISHTGYQLSSGSYGAECTCNSTAEKQILKKKTERF